MALPKIKRTAQFAHSGNVILTLLYSSDVQERKIRIEKIAVIRAKKLGDTSTK